MQSRWFTVGAAFILTLTLLSVLLVRTDPLAIPPGYRATVFLLIGLTVSLILVLGEGIRASVALRSVHFGRGIRRGAFAGLLTTILLYLSAESLFEPWNVITLVTAFLLIELYMSSRSLPLTKRTL